VANLYYNHPILNILAVEFNVTNERASLVPTLMQAGYAAGLLFLCPLGDIFRRRAFVLILVFFTATIVSEPLSPQYPHSLTDNSGSVSVSPPPSPYF
jgi:MFS family permease